MFIKDISRNYRPTPIRGEEHGERPHPQNGKIVVENDVLSEGSIFRKNLSKVYKNSNFLLNFQQKDSKYPYKFPNKLDFSLKREKNKPRF